MTQGGKRNGAGRPSGSTKPDSMSEKLVVRLTKYDKEKAEIIGNGNASKGIRIALADYDR